jgi:hypothetical protein
LKKTNNQPGGLVFIIREDRKSLPPEVAEAGKAEGFVHICDQSALEFGSDRKVPVKYRPVVSIRKDGPRAVVLPCTSKNNSGSPDFFELVNDKNVQWTKQWDGRRSFARGRYEVVDPVRMRAKVGVMPQSARIELLNWLKSRY